MSGGTGEVNKRFGTDGAKDGAAPTSAAATDEQMVGGTEGDGGQGDEGEDEGDLEELEEDDGSDGDDGGGDVLLGFLESPVHPGEMLRSHFPCKAGGKPAWLNPRDIPAPEATCCGNCHQPLRFLLQVQLPLLS